MGIRCNRSDPGTGAWVGIRWLTPQTGEGWASLEKNGRSEAEGLKGSGFSPTGRTRGAQRSSFGSGAGSRWPIHPVPTPVRKN